MAKEQKEKTAKKSTALVSIVHEINGISRLNVKAMEPELRARVRDLMAGISKAITEFGTSTLKIGQGLTEARDLLQERGARAFVAFINEIPGMAQTTAYRYIGAYEVAQNVFPRNILDRVLASGLAMIGTKDAPFGKYTEVIKRQKLLPPAAATPEQADEWIHNVRTAYDAKTKRGKHAKMADPSAMQMEAFKAVDSRFRRLPDNKRTIGWLTNLFAYLLSANGIAAPVSVDPKDPPEGWVKGTKKEEEAEEPETEK
jgi:hypothetical protein